jgi:hypothetical protein
MSEQAAAGLLMVPPVLGVGSLPVTAGKLAALGPASVK